MLLALADLISANSHEQLDLSQKHVYKPLLKAVNKLVCYIEARIEDFRLPYLVKYKLEDLLVAIFFAVLEGANNYHEIVYYTRIRLSFLKKFTNLKKVPSHDTFRRVLMNLDVTTFEETFVIFISDALKKARKYYAKKGQLSHIAIDGKTMNGSGRLHKSEREKRNIGTLNVYETSTGITLLTRSYYSKDSEIPLLRDSLDYFNVKHSVISADALHTQKETVTKISDKGGHYVLGLKENQGSLYEEAASYFAYNAKKLELKPQNYLKQELDKNRNQISRREYYMTNTTRFLNSKDWAKLKKIVYVKKTITNLITNEVSVEDRYYITSLTDLVDISYIIEAHWQIENNLHWHLDVAMNEDENLVSDKTAALNLSTIRKVSLNLLKLIKYTYPEKNVSIKSSRKILGWETDATIIRLFSILNDDEILKKLQNN